MLQLPPCHRSLPTLPAAHARTLSPPPPPHNALLQESLYAEISSWTDPEALEAQLAASAERRKRALHGEELRVVKQRKQEQKEKKRTAWLYT